MADQIEDGGPAFPVEHTSTPWAPGMSLRDWFAGLALAGICGGLCASPSTRTTEPCFDRAKGRFVFNSAAEDAYHIADAMIAARKGGAS